MTTVSYYLDNVPPKNRQDDQKSGQVDRCIKGHILKRPAEKLRKNYQVPRTRDREKFRDALHDAEDESLEDGHNYSLIPACRQAGSRISRARFLIQ